MSRKLLCLMSFVLVLGMASSGLARLEGYWPLDGDTLDASGNDRHGTLMGDADWVADPNKYVAGAVGLGIFFDGKGYVNIDGYKGISAIDGVQQEFSIANWFRTTGDGEMVTWGTSAGSTRLTWRVQGNRLRTEHGSGNLRGSKFVDDNEWHHGALVVSENANLRPANTQLYIDGVEETYRFGNNNRYNLGVGADVSIGRRADNDSRYFPGAIDEVYIFSRTMSAEQVAGVMNGVLPQWPKADRPSPADGDMLEENSVFLSWRPGTTAVSHDVYFGTTPDLGADQLASQQDTTDYLATGIVPDQTYYWRVDEVAADGTVTTGDVWTIVTPPRSAYAPSPDDGKAILDLTATLSWSGGWNPILHNVNFGTDPAALVPVSMMQTDTTYDPGPLEPGTTYYWRIDEFYGIDTVAGPVWSFSTVPVIPLTNEPNLVADWTMDDAAGDVVLDMSGNANHLLVFGGAQVVDGAIELDGIDDILEAPDNSINGIFDVNGSEFTAIASVNPSRLLPAASNHNVSNILLSRGSDPFNDNFEFGFSEDGNAIIYTDTDGGDTTRTVGDGDVTIGEWHQVIVVYDANAIDIYLDGIRYSTQVSGLFFDQADGSPFTIGDTRHIETPYGGLVGDVKIYDRAMSADEIRQTYLDPALAYEPDPAPASTDVDVLSVLSWTAGDGAVEHDVYLGTDKAAVAAADATDTSGIYRGRQAETTYAPGILEFGAKLYWRVDEVAADGTVSTGKVWSLSTATELVIYDVPTPFDYDTSVDPFTSEISLDLDPAQNWTDPIARFAVNYTGQAAPGSVSVDDVAGTTTVVGRGADIWGSADEFQYAYTTLTGNGTMTVKVDSLDATHAWTKAGIMIRETLDAGSAYAGIFATRDNGVRFQFRSMANQPAEGDNAYATDEAKALTPPVWIKIERTFPMVNAYYSTDGVAFVPVGPPQVVPMSPAPINIGLAVTSHSGSDTYATAVFSELTSDGGVVPGPLTSAEIGLASNAAAPMSLVLTDASGASDAVVNPDPAATQQSSATDFIVDLADFNIDLTAVVRATMVIGDGSPGGSGSLTINNVRLLGPKPPVGHWTLDGNADDSSATGANGTVVGDPVWVAGMVGDALELDGVDDYVDCGNPAELDFGTGDFTISAWIKLTTTERATVYAKGGDNSGGIRYTLAMGESNDNKMTLTTDDDSDKRQAKGATVVNDGAWHHVVGMRSGDMSYVYVDGVQDGSIDLPAGYDLSGTSQANALLGAITDARDATGATLEKFFTGTLDDVRVYDRALSDAEIAKLAGL